MAQEALEWGMETAGLKRGVIIVMNPQTGEILAHGQPARRTTTTPSRAASATPTSRRCSTTRTSRSSTTPSNAHYPPGSTYKLVTGIGGLADGKITPTSPADHRSPT